MAAAGAGGGGSKKKKSSTASQPAAPAAPAAPEPKPEPPAPEPVKADPPAPGAPGTSKKAKAKAKAEAAAAAEAAPPPPPEPQPKAKAKAKGKAEPQPEAKAEAAKPKADAKAKSQPKAEAKSQPKAEAKSQPKAEAKGKAKAEPKKEEPEVEEVKPEPKAASKKKPKASSDAKSAPAPPKVEEEEEVKPKKEPDLIPGRVADAHELNAADWEEVKPGTKKDQRRKERKEEDAKVAATAGPKNQKLVPGMAPPEALVPAAKQKAIPGMAPAKELKVAVVCAGGAPPPPVAAQEPAKEAGPPASMATVKVPEKMIGVVIGPKGATLKAIQEKTGVARIDTSGDTFTIMGPEKGVGLAELAIQELASKGYASILIDNFAQAYIQVHPVFFPEIIGKEGKVIRTIQEKLGVRVQIPETPKDAMKEKKKYRINLAGSDENVQKAKQVLTDITTVYHSEITHEGIVHEEMEIDEWNKRFIIGKGGCEIRHIQHNFKVRLYIPNENSVNDKTVIVGERHAVDRAKTYIEKVLWNAENIPRGREANTGAFDGDTWGDEEAAEPWMDAYLYKRK